MCLISIDSFLRARNSQDHEATAMMKAQFMSLWDGLITDPSCTIIIMGATNRPQDLDRAILRRMPATFHIGLPVSCYFSKQKKKNRINNYLKIKIFYILSSFLQDEQQRKKILHLILDNEPIAEDLDILKLAKLTDGFSGSDLQELCRNASVYRVRDYLRNHTV